MRELDRERTKMEQQEKKIIADIKKMAKQGQMDAVKVMAKVSRSVVVFAYSSNISGQLSIAPLGFLYKLGAVYMKNPFYLPRTW